MLWVILIIILGLVGYIGYSYNDFVSTRNKIKEEWETICTSLKDRFTVLKELMDKNKEISFNYQEVNDLVDNLQKVTSKQEFIPMYQTFETRLKEYVNLVDNNNNLDVLNRLNNTNGKIEYIKNFYNDDVDNYNKKIDMFPTNIIAKVCSFTKDVLIP